MKPRICVDFDGTIWDGKAVMPGCIEALTRLRESYWIAIFSARATQAERYQMVNLLIDHKVPYDELLERKPEAVCYVDDKGWRFTAWSDLPF